MSETCRQCQTAAHIIRRIGFRDTISWGVMGGPSNVLHATHANASRKEDRPETEDEYKRRKAEAEAYGSKAKIKPFGQTVTDKHQLPLCRLHSTELAWLAAGRPTRVTVYMAHPVSGPDFHDNVLRATKWLKYLRRLPQSTINELVGCEFQQRPLILCPWLAAIEEDEMYPGGREAVIADSRDAVMMFDEVWLLGGRITDGMRVEAQAARVLRDLTHLGESPGQHVERK